MMGYRQRGKSPHEVFREHIEQVVHADQLGFEIAWFAEQLSIQGIDLVGVLDQPPPELRAVFRGQGRLPASSARLMPSRPLAPVMRIFMLSLKTQPSRLPCRYISSKGAMNFLMPSRSSHSELLSLE